MTAVRTSVRASLAVVVLVAVAFAIPFAADAHGLSAPSLKASATTSSISLSWKKRAGRSYQLRYRRGHASWRVLSLGRSRSYTLRKLAAATTYSFAIRACTARACSPWSRTLKQKTRSGGSGSGPPAGGGTLTPGVGTGGCPVFPSDNPWNRDVSGDPVDGNSANYIASIGNTTNLHPDFGSNPTYGIPYVVVGATQPLVRINFTAYGDQSDPGPYPVPGGAPVEGGAGAGGDRHVLVLQTGACKLFEMYRAFPQADGSWNADSGAVFNLNSNALRPDTWTSADAAGLPIFPGLIRYDEIQAGAINHAIRFTVARTQNGFIHPATHQASSYGNPNYPPMGLRVRLKAGYDISGFGRTAQIILTAMKKYGMFVADNGSNWYFGGATDSRWNDDELNPLKSVPGSAFEAVNTGQPILRG
jgi:hypothetical protein